MSTVLLSGQWGMPVRSPGQQAAIYFLLNPVCMGKGINKTFRLHIWYFEFKNPPEDFSVPISSLIHYRISSNSPFGIIREAAKASCGKSMLAVRFV